MVSSGELSLSFDARILAEYEEVLGGPKFKFKEDMVIALLDHIRHLRIDSSFLSLDLDHCRIYDDEPFLEVAIAGRVACLVTGNKNHFPPVLCRGIAVFSPSDFLKFYDKRLKKAR